MSQTMNFFEHQELARKRTGRLIVLFVFAVLCIAVALYAVGLLVFGIAGAQQGGVRVGVGLWNPMAAAFAVGIAVLLIGGGTAYKLHQLRAGGRVIAEQLGGTLLTHASADAAGRRVLNVVEEMAIASGTPVPPVYLLENEPAINAFAAGYRPEDAVIGVTRGCAEKLSRDQLQGVIAHEFSHILSGDMRLNLRLVGVLHGILLLGMTGMMILRTLVYSGGMRRRSSKNEGGVLAAIMVVAAALAVIGFIGTFFGNWIKAAVSRQREFLADASAVQFTRNPDGIAGALKKIGGTGRGARLKDPNAAQASHMFFGNALSSGLSSLFATHPPLAQRIRRIDPSWDGSFDDVSPAPSPSAARAAGVSGFAGAPAAPGIALDAGHAVHGVDRMTDAHLELARALIVRVPRPILDASRDPYSARAVILAMLLDPGLETRRTQTARVRGADPVLASELDRLASLVASLAPELRLPVLEQAMGPLASLSARQIKQFRGLVEDFIRADDRVDLFEWILHRLVTRRLEAASGRAAPRRVQYYGLGRLGDPCSVLLSAVARVGAADEDAARAAFDSGAGRLRGVPVSFRGGSGPGLRQLAIALDALDAAAPKLKRSLLEACAAVIMHDRAVTPTEAELYRAVAESLGVPTPLMVAGGVAVSGGGAGSA